MCPLLLECLSQILGMIDGGQIDLMSYARLPMTIYLGTSSQVGQNGRPYLDDRQVADFATRALRKGRTE